MNGFYNPYMLQGNYMTELQNMRDRIDGQIQQMQQQQQSMGQAAMQQPQAITQNFQLAPSTASNNFKLVNSIEDVKKEIVVVDTYFLGKDNSQMWIKNPRGEIRTFTITEIIPKDEKDLLIEDLQKQLQKLKGGNKNERNQSNDDELLRESVETEKSSNVSNVSNGKTTKHKSE